MKKLTNTILLSSLLVIATVISATAQPATLAWDQSTQPDIIGYKVYYQVGSPTFPFNGTTLLEGASPIVVNGATNSSLTIDLPEDGNVYYFTATAISDAGLESNFSDILASEWVPSLLAPVNETVLNSSAVFSWELPPAGYNVTYDLYYGTDPDFKTTLSPVVSSESFTGWPQLETVSVLPFVMILLMVPLILPKKPNRRWHPLRTAICIGIFTLQVSCGGGGGGETVAAPVSPSPITPTTPAPTTPTFTNVITNISSTDYFVSDLQPDSQYYWKIVAVDDQGFSYESVGQSFTTN